MFWKNFFLRYFPTPRFLEMPYVGIDISSLAVRMVDIPYRSTLRVKRYDEKFLSAPFSITGDLMEIKNILKDWKKKHRLNYVKISLPEEHAYLFQKEMTFDSDEKMRQAIEFVLEENVPVNGADSMFDYRLSEISEKQEGLVSVAVTVFPVEVIQKYIFLFSECGLTPISFMIEAQALARAVIRRGDKGTYLIVHSTETKTGLFIISKEAIQFTSTVASQPKEEVQKVISYWHSKKNQEKSWTPIQKIILCGKEIADLGVPTEIGNVWTNLDSFRGYVPPIIHEESLAYGPAIGLALPENE